ncbi:hypothetical protein JEY40_32680 [Bradyrhizobium japonicum]|uniref:hypothetical protein n=1 Tax=Bradyrhizobium japonicum TaxID=375 RepID=UPI00200EB247|nr:hypothetical protein [Bradyrhizobium japonicum]UQD70657.1 hypothetical protein JEY40_32680 [Bradyrhizobium japonicum]
MSFGVASISGSIAAFYSELFDTRIRHTGLVFAKEVSGAVVRGFTPLISTLLVQWSGGPSWPVSVYMMMVTALAAFCAPISPGTSSTSASETSQLQRNAKLLRVCVKSWTILAAMRDDERDGDANQQEHLANIAKSTHGAMSDHQKRRTK